ncbi:MAG: hypothetical protein U0269_03000 [Polyangiales bacterium]
MSDSPAIDARGRFRRCTRCGWLDDRSESRCVQCGTLAEPHTPTTAAIGRRVVRSASEPRERSLDEIQAIRDAIATRSPLRLTPIARTALVDLDGRALLVAPDEQRRRDATREVIDAIAAMRGEVALWSDDASADRDDRVRPAKSLADADVVVVTRALALSRAQRDALSAVRWLIVSDPAPLSKSIASLYELVALTRPELARTRRGFLARFTGADRTPAAQAALGSLLARVVLRVSPETPLSPELAMLDRWLDAAPRG